MRCVCIALRLLSAELLQVLDGLDSFSPAHQKCLRELQEICGARRKLPESYIPRCMDDTPGHDNCGPGEIFQWKLYWTSSVEPRRMFPLDQVFSPEGTEVGGTFLASPAFLALLTKATAPSQCSSVEISEASKPPSPHQQPHLCRIGTPYDKFDLDIWQEIMEICCGLLGRHGPS